MSKVFVVEDTWQYDGGSFIHGIFTDSNNALICQQKWRRFYSRQTNYPDYRLECIGIREIELNKEIEDV